MNYTIGSIDDDYDRYLVRSASPIPFYDIIEQDVHSVIAPKSSNVLLDKLDKLDSIPTPDGTKCTICTNRYYNDNSNMIQFSCTHYFHKDCIIEWAKIKDTCPVCRNILIDYI